MQDTEESYLNLLLVGSNLRKCRTFEDGLSLVSCSQLSLIFPFVCNSVIFQVYEILTDSYPRCGALLFVEKITTRQTIDIYF